MKLRSYTVALATTAALVGAGLAVPSAFADNITSGTPTAATAAAPSAPVDGFSWPNVEVVAGDEVTIKPSKEATDDYRFSGIKDAHGWTFTYDNKTGIFTAKAPVDARPGQAITITTEVSKLNADKTKWEVIGTYKHTVTVIEGGNNHANTHEVTYDKLTVKEKQSATANRKGDVPAGTTYTIEKKSDHIDATVDANGNITVTPHADTGAGSTAYVHLKVTYPDKSYEYTNLSVIVADKDGNTTPHKDRDNAKYDPEWAPSTDLNGNAGVATTAKQTKDVPAGTKFAIVPKYAEDIEKNLTTSFNDKGDLTVTPKKPLKGDTKIEIPVEITYPDKSSEQKLVTFKVTTEGKWDSQKTTIIYPEITTPADQPGTSTPQSDAPKGTTFALNAKAPKGWTINVDKLSLIHISEPTRPAA